MQKLNCPTGKGGTWEKLRLLLWGLTLLCPALVKDTKLLEVYRHLQNMNVQGNSVTFGHCSTVDGATMWYLAKKSESAPMLREERALWCNNSCTTLSTTTLTCDIENTALDAFASASSTTGSMKLCQVNFFLQWEIMWNISKLWQKVVFSTHIYQLLMQMKFYMYLYQCTPWLTCDIETSVASGVIFCIQFCCFVDALATAVQSYQAFMWCAKVLIGLMGHIEDTF